MPLAYTDFYKEQNILSILLWFVHFVVKFFHDSQTVKDEECRPITPMDLMVIELICNLLGNVMLSCLLILW